MGRAFAGEGERYFMVIGGGEGTSERGALIVGEESCRRLAVGHFMSGRTSLDCLENNRKGAWVDGQANSSPGLLLRANRNLQSHWPISVRFWL